MAGFFVVLWQPQQIAQLGAPQVHGLTHQHTAAFSPIQFQNLPHIGQLTGPAFAALTPACIAQITPNQVQALAAQQTGAMEPDQFGALHTFANLSPAAFAGIPQALMLQLSGPQAQTITPGQAGRMTPEQFANLLPIRLSDLQPNTFAALDANNCIANLNQQKTEAITPGQAARITPAQFAAFPHNVLRYLAANAFGRLSPNDCIANLDQDKTAAITNLQAAAITQEQFEQFPAPMMQHLQPAAFTSLNGANCIAHLGQAQVLGLTDQQMGQITPDMFEHFPADRIPDLTWQRFALINQNCYARFTPQQAAELTAGQVHGMGGAKAAFFPENRRNNLSAAAFASFLNYLGGIKPRAKAVSDYIFANGVASLTPVFRGNAPYGNFNNKLPTGIYREFDIYPDIPGQRGKYRIVIGQLTANHNWVTYYTRHHYNDFVELD